MPATKSPVRSSSRKPPVPAPDAIVGKTKPPTRAKSAAPPVATTPGGRSIAHGKIGVPFEQRNHYIEIAAYYIAGQRGFAPGNLLEDWRQAEEQIDRLLSEGHLGN